MINLCYATKAKSYELVPFLYENIISFLSFNSNLILVPTENLYEDIIRYVDGGKLVYSRYYHYRSWLDLEAITTKIDIEKISAQELDNIILLNFDSFKSDILHSIINKSKKTEILGITLPEYYNEDIRSSTLEIQSMINDGYSNDQIIVILSLAYNYPVDILEKTLDNVRFTHSQLKIRDVNYLSDTLKFLKLGKYLCM